MDKASCINNVVNLTAEQLFHTCIFPGNVTIEELMATGNLDSSKRRRIADLQKESDLKDEVAWARARYGNEASLSDYITNFPNGKYVQAAKDRIKHLEDERQRATAEKQGILDKLKRNSNNFTPVQISNYLKSRTITAEDLRNYGIPDKIVSILHNVSPPYLELGETPNSIPTGYTEVYFWGNPGSGKTCALAAILSAAEHAGYLEIATGPGYNYMTLLKNIFIDDIAILPPPTNLEKTQYLPFVLKRGKDKPRSVSLIELSGEIFQCFYKKNAGSPLLGERERTFNTLMNYLGGKNRKIHFFFVDFEKENKKDDEGKTQGDYLNAASTFFQNKDIFGKTTDAIYLVVTKSDLLNCSIEQRVTYAKQHLQNNNFSAFINTLKARCNQHSINAGKLTVEPFSLGKVFFQQMCVFDKTSAKSIVDILIDRIPPQRNSLLDVFNK